MSFLGSLLTEPEWIDPAQVVTPADIDLLAQFQWRDSDLWYEHLAWWAWMHQRFEIIPTREGGAVYLVRFWLSEPSRSNVRSGLESGNADLLHFFCRGDDDRALHDHPWHFESEILAGGYEEHLPPLDWHPYELLGPEWDRHKRFWEAGNRIAHKANDLHCVGRVMRGTWTRVKTGPRVRSWGFHPPGLIWQSFEDFLARARRGPQIDVTPSRTKALEA